MKISKRVQEKLRKENFAAIADGLGLTRAAVSIWVKKGEVPHWHILPLGDCVGYKIK